MKRLIPVLLSALLCASAWAQDPLEAALRDPPATGLLILRVEEGSQAAAKGMRAGDVLVSYDGVEVADLEALRASIGAAAGKAALPCVLVRPSGERVELELAPGRIGVSLSPVEKGKGPGPLPPETGVEFDFSALRDGKPREEWLSFHLGDATEKAGYEHAVLRLEGGKLIVRREVAFDGGEQYGLQHFDVTITAIAGATPIAVALRFVTPLTGWVGEAELILREDGRRAWRMTSQAPGQPEQGSESTAPDRLPLLPTYFLETLATFMPRSEGACVHFRAVEDGSGELLFPSALVVVGEEKVDLVDGARAKAWRIEHRRLGGVVAGTFWVDGRGRKLKSEFGGGARAFLVTREEALKGVPDRLKPRSAR